MTRLFQPTIRAAAAPVRWSARCRHILSGSTVLGGLARIALAGAFGALTLAAPARAQGLPTGGNVAAGSAAISGNASSVTIHQTSASVAINWQSFDIAAGKSVTFVQPNASAVALNRVTGSDPSAILGNLSANGKLFLINPNGILFGQSARVNVGGLVASTLNMADADFMAGHYRFAGTGGGSVVNQGRIDADGGAVALLGGTVRNDGVIQARLGTIVLAAGEAMTLDMAGDGLISVAIDTGAVDALVSNGGLIRADGGSVVMTAQAAGQLLHTVVNNSGIIEARTIDGRNGSIMLLGDMQGGTTNVAGTLDASAPNGGNGGFIETSAAHVNVADSAIITTAASAGLTGTWLIDPQDFIIAPTGGNISGATLSALLVTNSVTISTLPGSDATVAGTPPVTSLNTALVGNGDIFVNDAIAWVAAPSTTTLSLNAVRDILVNAPITATNGNVVLCCGRDANINAAITTVNGSVLVGAGRDINLAATGAMTTTDGNLTFCAGNDIVVAGAITLTRGSTIPAQSLNLPAGLVLIAGTSGTGPGPAGGTVIFAPLTPPVTVTNAAVTLNYNPVSYAVPTDYSGSFTLTQGAILTQHMLVFPTATKAYDGTATVTLAGFNSTAQSGLPAGVTLVAGPAAAAVFDDAAVSGGTGVTFSDYALGGANASQYALAGGACCVATFRTTGTITAAAIIVPPAGTSPVGTVPVDVTPIVTTPVVTTPVTTPGATSPGSTPVTTPVTSPGTTPVTTPISTPGATPPVELQPVVTIPVTTPVGAGVGVTAPAVTSPVTIAPVATSPVFVPVAGTQPGVRSNPAPTSAILVNAGVAALAFPTGAGGIQLATIGEGVRMPAAPQPIAPAAVQPQAPSPALARATRAAAPVYRPKQDRH